MESVNTPAPSPDGTRLTFGAVRGDGQRDVKTARDLGYPFVGVGEGERAARLVAAGARHVVADFSDPDAVLHLMETASAGP